MFIDKAVITIISGDGGDGCMSFTTAKGKPNGGPDGGDGGNGGNIIFRATTNINNLIEYKFKQHFRAEKGVNGSSQNCYGKCGKDVVLMVPCGTIIRDKETNLIMADLFDEGEEIVILKGGRGGKGNTKFKNSRRKTPMFAQSGEKAEQKQVILELKTIADAGFIGFPNVGKSTLLSVLTSARPKIANYHFTTLSPNLGVVQYEDESFVLADIPGLIEGAANGAGLGHAFLRHIERTRMLIHVIDISGCEDRDPYEDYLAIRKELEQFSEVLIDLPEIIVANKADSDFESANYDAFVKKIEGKTVIKASALTRDGIEELLKEVIAMLRTLPKQVPTRGEMFSYEKPDGEEFFIDIDEEGVFEVTGALIDNISRRVVVDNMESLSYLQSALKNFGVITALRRRGAKEGSVVRLLDIEFDFYD